MEIYQVGPLSVNCYFLINTDTSELLVVDPGGNAVGLAKKIKDAGYKPVAILLTHGHFDHILGANELHSIFNIPILAHRDEEAMLLEDKESLFHMTDDPKALVIKADKFVTDKEELELAGYKIRVMHTPGHSLGSCCYYLYEEDILMSGDTLFEGSIGRTDFPGGSMAQMKHSLNEVLMKLPDNVKVFPGHGGYTSIGMERQNNPYVR